MDIKDVTWRNYSNIGRKLTIHPTNIKDTYTIEYKNAGAVCVYEIRKSNELVEDITEKRELLETIVRHLANKQNHELSTLIFMAYIDGFVDTDNIVHQRVPVVGCKFVNKNLIKFANEHSKDFSIVLVETSGRLTGHISTLIVDKKADKYYLFDPSENVHQQKIQGKMYTDNDVFDRDDVGKKTTILNKNGLLLQNEWSCTYWAMCTTKILATKNSITDIIENGTFKTEVFDEIIKEIKNIDQKLINQSNCQKFIEEIKQQQKKQTTLNK